MRTPVRPLRQRIHALITGVLLIASSGISQAQQLESWVNSESKQALLDFVARVTRDRGPDYVAPAERIAVFDNDGTLWAEQPMYFQFAFALDRVKMMSPNHPEWKTTAPFKEVLAGDSKVLAGDSKALAAGGQQDLLQIMAASHSGMTTEDFYTIVGSWLVTARHPRFSRPYTQLVYQPMLELLDYLRSHRFTTFIVSGGGIEFMRVFAEDAYGIPPEQVIGSSGVTRFVQVGTNGKPALIKEPRVEIVDDGAGKPASIHRAIGRRPILAFGNSDGDQQMLEWTAGGAGARFVALIHHTDDKREYAYDRQSHIGRLDQALDEAREQGWVVIDMKQDWRRVFPGDDHDQ